MNSFASAVLNSKYIICEKVHEVELRRRTTLVKKGLAYMRKHGIMNAANMERRMERRMFPTVKITVTAVFTALVCISTMMFSIYVPATRGYFNIGEAMVYTAALLFGPVVGAIAGGVGSALADAALGYWIYVPATLLIKACEGAIVGLLSRRIFDTGTVKQWRSFTILIGCVLAVLLGYIGTSIYTGVMEVSVGFPLLGSMTLSADIPAFFWIGISLAVVVFITYIGLRFNPKIGWIVLSMLFGGIVMVLGYFSYQWILYGVAAVVEIPVNIGQSLIGIVISLPLVNAIRKRLPWLLI